MNNQSVVRTIKSDLSLFILVLLTGLCLVFWQPLFTYKTLYWRDIIFAFMPFLEFISQSLKNGDFPLWNPYVFTGTPQLATLQLSVLYPFNWLFMFFSFDRILLLNLILHYTLAGVGVFLYCREQQWHWGSCGVAGLAYPLSGVLISLNNAHPLLFSSTWIPWLLWLAHRLMVSPRKRDLFFFSICYTLQCISGHLEIVYYTSLLLLIYIALPQIHPGKNKIRWLILAMATGIGMAAIQLIPTAEFLVHSVRQSGVNFKMVTGWSLHPFYIPALFIPQFFGDIFANLDLLQLLGHTEMERVYMILSYYLGIPACIMALVGVLYYRQIKKPAFFWFWLGTLLMAFLLSLGHHFPLYKMLYHFFPGWHFFRFPLKFLIFMALALAILAGQGSEIAYQGKSLKNWYGAVGGAGLILIISAIGLYWQREAFTSWVASLVEPQRLAILKDQLSPWVNLLLNHMFKQMTMVLAWLLLLILMMSIRHRISAIYFWLSLMGLLMVDSMTANGSILWVTDREFLYQKPPLVQELQKLGLTDPHTRFIKAGAVSDLPETIRQTYHHTPLWGETVFHQQVMNDHLSLRYRFYNASANWSAELSPSSRIHALYQQAIVEHLPEIRNQIETLLGVRFILALNPRSEIQRYLKTHPQWYQEVFHIPTLNVKVWENLHWQSRVHFKYQAFVVDSEEKMYQGIARATDIGFDPRQQVLLLKDDAYKQALKTWPSQAVDKKSWTPPRIIESGNNYLKIQFETQTSGYLVLADQNYPGWQANLNGEATPILKANYFQRAVRVPPGKHVVEFTYRPVSFLVGAMISLTVLLIYGLFLWLLPEIDENTSS